jgi:hypothetical protein
MRRRFDLTPLGHPVWWGALALLLINDDLFKGRGVVPGWLTGKLSDFAFLIVAPVLFAALIPRGLPGRRTLAVVSVTGLYVAADLSRAVSDAVVALAARFGLTWRLWPDPTDLAALAVLPITVWLLRRQPQPSADSPAARGNRLRRERAGIVFGALACLATSGTVSGYPHSPFMLNRTAAPVDVRITWVLRKVDCAILPEALATILTPSDLDDPRTLALASGDVAALDGIPPSGTSPVGACTTRIRNPGNISMDPPDQCVAAILETAGATPVLMVADREWNEDDSAGLISCCESPAPVSQCKSKLDPAKSPGPDALSIVDSGGVLRIELSGTGRDGQGTAIEDHIKIGPIDPAAIAARPPAADGCRETRDAYRTLLQSTACASDGDCLALPAIGIPGEPASCDVYVNRTVSEGTLQSLERLWEIMCASSVDFCPPALPALCRAGACTALCAGVALPFCPSLCRDQGITPGNQCDGPLSCLDDAGRSCTCLNTVVTCAPFPQIDASCPLGCRPTNTVTVTPDAGGAQDGSGQ